MKPSLGNALSDFSLAVHRDELLEILKKYEDHVDKDQFRFLAALVRQIALTCDKEGFLA